MPSANDNVNLLPDSERKDAEAALRRAAQKPTTAEVKLVMPQPVLAPKTEEKKSWFARRREAKQKVQAEAAKNKPAVAAPTLAKPVKIEPMKSAPIKPLAPVAPLMPTKPVNVAMPAPKPVVKPATKPQVEVKKAEKKLEIKKPEPKKPETKKAGSLHEPETAEGFSSPGVNLVPQDVAAEAQGSPWSLYAGILIVVAGLWVAVSGYAISRAKRAESQIQELQARLNQVNVAVKDYETDKKAHEALQKQFTTVKALVDSHIYWTPFLQKLEETTIPDVYYLGVSANRNGDITLRAVAKSYSAAARQIRAFERASTFVQSVQVNQARQELQKGATLPVPVIAVDIQLKLVPSVFTLTVPENTPAAPVAVPAPAPINDPQPVTPPVS